MILLLFMLLQSIIQTILAELLHFKTMQTVNIGCIKDRSESQDLALASRLKFSRFIGVLIQAPLKALILQDAKCFQLPPKSKAVESPLYFEGLGT